MDASYNKRKRGEVKKGGEGLCVNTLELPIVFVTEAFTCIWYTFIIYKSPSYALLFTIRVSSSANRSFPKTSIKYNISPSKANFFSAFLPPSIFFSHVI